MGYINTRTTSQKRNIDLIIDTMNKLGVKNKYTQASILAIISKESGFDPSPEKSYKNTSSSSIRNIFGSRVSDLSDDEINSLKKDRKAFFNKVYGKRYGNDGYSTSWNGYNESWDLPYKDGNDGSRYAGAGFNQLTFKGNYKKLSEASGIDLLKNPELLQNPKVASEVAVKYMMSKFDSGYSSSHQQHYNSPDIDSFTSLNDSTLAVYHANAGFGKPMYSISSGTSTGGLEKALDRAPEFLEYIKSSIPAKKKTLLIIVSLVLVALLTVGIIYLFKQKKK
jgi:predicted chitinase